MEASDAAHLGGVDELDVAPLAANEALALHVREHAVDVDGRLAGDVGDLLLRERIDQAIVRSEVMIGQARDFDPLVEQNPEMHRFFCRLIQRNEDISYEWLVNCGRRDATARVAHLLCETAARMNAADDRLANPFTQQQIADITGQTSVNVNRVLADMERQGLIRRKGRDIEFVDWPEMRRVGSFQPAYLEI